TPEDYFAFEFASDPNLSPDGKLVAYVVTKIDRAQNRRNSSIWMAATDGSRAPWQFTTSPQSANSPRWSPDGKSLAFLSSRQLSDSTSPAPAASPNSMILVGSTIAAHTFGSSISKAATPNRSLKATTGMTAIRNGRPMARASLSSRTAPARNMKRIATAMCG